MNRTRSTVVVAAAATIATFSPSRAAEVAGKVYNGSEVIHGTVQNQGDGGCGTLNFNSDGTYENGYCWQYGGCVSPNYGAFAECYGGTSGMEVCSLMLDLTQIGSMMPADFDIYVWADADGGPGNVLCSVPNFRIGGVAFWPAVSRHAVPVTNCCVEGTFWAGFWGSWPNAGCADFVGADLDGLGGCPFTNIAPGIGYPTGWNNVSVVWGPTQAIGIGVETNPCEGTASRRTTWGAIKRLSGE